MSVVYILYSQKLNPGSTSNFSERMNFHDSAEARKFTAKASDWILFYKIDCNNKEHALQIEKHIKSMKSRIYIENLKKYPEIIQKLRIT